MAKAARSRTHKVVVTLRFDKPVTRQDAAKAARNYIYGTVGYGDPNDGWGEMKAGAIRPLTEAPEPSASAKAKARRAEDDCWR